MGMAEQRPLGSRRHSGSRGGRSWSGHGATSGPRPGRPSSVRPPSPATTRPTSHPTPSPPSGAASTAEPSYRARTTDTRSTYRQLLLRGLSPDEAADLTAFLAGFAVGSKPWKLIEVNRILFLGALARGGRWGPDDGSGPGSA